MSVNELRLLRARIEACADCHRLVRYRERIATAKRRAYRDQTYHGRPVAGFGDSRARIVIVGLAPGAHGANRTGRVFTGDRSGDFLFAALFRAGLASQPDATSAHDGLRLHGAFITLAARCAPPDNRPTPVELRRCARWFDAELDALPHKRVLVALGSIAFTTVLGFAARNDITVPKPAPRFAHGAEVQLGSLVLLASYHVSQQNTQTGRLTPHMFDAVLERAGKILMSGS